jgi:hypothetical protein
VSSSVRADVEAASNKVAMKLFLTTMVFIHVQSTDKLVN